jgi:hypothetical protein
VQDAQRRPLVTPRCFLFAAASWLYLSRCARRYGFCSSSASLAQVVAKAQSSGSSSDSARAVLSLEDVLDAPLPPCPLEPSLRAHWLAVNGVQPVIEENPSEPTGAAPLAAAPAHAPAPQISSAAPAPASAPAPTSASACAPAPDAAATKDVSQELFLFFEKVGLPPPHAPPPHARPVR